MGVPMTLAERYPPEPPPDPRGVWVNHLVRLGGGSPTLWVGDIYPDGRVTMSVNNYANGWIEEVPGVRVGGGPVPIPLNPGWVVECFASAGLTWVLLTVRRADQC